MTVFRRSVSWSKFDLALKCPLRLQKTIEKEYSPKFGAQTKAASMGKLVQKVFELYFNGDFNLKEGGLRPQVLVKILDKVLASKWCDEEGVLPEFREEAIPQLEKGFELFMQEKVMGYRIRSEVEMKVTFNGFRMFGMLDFLVNMPGGSILYDGKGNAAENADPNQLKYYALTLHAANVKVLSGGFIYWKHGYRSVDVSPEGLHEFVNGDFARGRKVFERLKVGVDRLESSPSSKNCHFCNWRDTCPDTYYRKDSGPVLIGVQEVGF